MLDFDNPDALFLPGEIVLDSQRNHLRPDERFHLRVVGSDGMPEGFLKCLFASVCREQPVDAFKLAPLGFGEFRTLGLGGLYGVEAVGLGGLGG